MQLKVIRGTTYGKDHHTTFRGAEAFFEIWKTGLYLKLGSYVNHLCHFHMEKLKIIYIFPWFLIKIPSLKVFSTYVLKRAMYHWFMSYIVSIPDTACQTYRFTMIHYLELCILDISTRSNAYTCILTITVIYGSIFYLTIAVTQNMLCTDITCTEL